MPTQGSCRRTLGSRYQADQPIRKEPFQARRPGTPVLPSRRLTFSLRQPTISACADRTSQRRRSPPHLVPEPTPTATPNPTAEPTATFIPTPAPANTPTSTPTVTPLALSAKEVLEAATVAVKDIDSGHFEGEFTYEGEIEETKQVLSIYISGVFLTPGNAHWSTTYDFESPFIVDIGGDEVDIARENWTQEWFAVGDYVYLLDSLGGNARHRRDDIVLSFEPSDLFELDLLDIDGEISAYEQELDGERVYHVTGPAAPDRSYPLLGRTQSIDGVVGYWIGAEDHLLRRLEVSVVSVDPTSGAETQRLDGFVVLSHYGESVDIRPPVSEDVDDHGKLAGECD